MGNVSVKPQITDEMVYAGCEAVDKHFSKSDWISAQAMREALTAALSVPCLQEPVAWLAEGPGWGRVFIEREAAEKLAAQDGALRPLYAQPVDVREQAIEALKPFADVLSEYDPTDEDDETPATLVVGSVTDYSLTLGDLRRAARELLALLEGR